MTPLHTLLGHVANQRDSALAHLARAETQARQLRAQRAQLLAFRDDYRQRDPAQAGRSATMGMLRHHRAFMQRLQQAVDQQQAQTDGIEQQLVQLRQNLLRLEQRLASVKKLLERRQQAAQMLLARRDQRQSDEAAQQSHRRESASVWHDPG